MKNLDNYILEKLIVNNTIQNSINNNEIYNKLINAPKNTEISLDKPIKFEVFHYRDNSLLDTFEIVLIKKKELRFTSGIIAQPVHNKMYYYFYDKDNRQCVHMPEDDMTKVLKDKETIICNGIICSGADKIRLSDK